MALACESTVLINLSDGDLNRCVVLGLDDSVGCAALSWDVAVEEEGQFQLDLFTVIAAVALMALGLRTDQRVLPYRSPYWQCF